MPLRLPDTVMLGEAPRMAWGPRERAVLAACAAALPMRARQSSPCVCVCV